MLVQPFTIGLLFSHMLKLLLHVVCSLLSSENANTPRLLLLLLLLLIMMTSARLRCIITK